MLLTMHIVVALASIIVTGLSFFKPGTTKIKLSLGLITLTLLSGTYLVISQPVHILSTCVTGLVYCAGTFYGVYAAKNKMAAEIYRTK